MWWDGVGLPRVLRQMLQQNPILRPTCQVHLYPSSGRLQGGGLICHLPSLISVASLSPAFTVLETGLLVGPQDPICSSHFHLAPMTLLPPRSICPKPSSLTSPGSPRDPHGLPCPRGWRVSCEFWWWWFRGRAWRRDAWTQGFCGLSFTAMLRRWWGLYLREEKREAQRLNNVISDLIE